MPRFTCAFTVALTCLSAISFSLEAQQMRVIDFLPNSSEANECYEVSGDGSAVVGSCLRDVWEPFVYRVVDDELVSVGTMFFESATVAHSITSDGSMIAGWGAAPFLWTEDGGFDSLDGCFVTLYPWDISADGSVAVGDVGGSPYIWTADTGCDPIGATPSGNPNGSAYGISADGTIVVGSYRPQGTYQAFRWTESQGIHNIGSLAANQYASYAGSISADGNVIVGLSGAPPGTVAVRWTGAEAEIDALGVLDSGDFYSVAEAVSGDGSVIIGTSKVDGEETAFLWTEELGMEDLAEYLKDAYGLELEGWKLTRGTGISDDGLVIAGDGINPDGRRQSWVADLRYSRPEFVRGDCNGNAEVELADVLCLLNFMFDKGSVPCAAAEDSNGDGRATVADPIYLLAYMFSDGAAPPLPFPSCGFLDEINYDACEVSPDCAKP